jgi:hypothetical protein
MRFVDNLRKAEEKSVRTIRRGVERVRDEWSDVERRIRQRMRVYPQKRIALQEQRTMMTAAPTGQPSLEHEVPEDRTDSSEPRKPIVSVHGHDLNDT